MYALNLAEDGRVLSITYEKYASEDMPIVEEFPEGNTYEYRYVDGEYVHDPLPQGETEPTAPAEPTLFERVNALETEATETREALDMILSGVIE